MRDHQDKTFDRAFGHVDREWRKMAAKAIYIREGRFSPQWTEEHLKEFTGIFKRLLTDPIDSVREEAGWK